MSIWKDIHQRSNGTSTRREDLDGRIKLCLESFNSIESIQSWLFWRGGIEHFMDFNVIVEDRDTGKLETRTVRYSISTDAMTNEIIKIFLSDNNIKMIKDAIDGDIFVSIEGNKRIKKEI